ncbi:MAG: hypothetical protein KC591_07025, partial [Gemmatimonadetes bacterium]|nr:hypothetical protein [Gemmatimonadota bacterium]
MRVLARLLLAGTVALFATAAPLAAAPSVDDGSGGTLLGGSEHEGTVTARLLSEADAIAPGTTFTVAVEIRMQPGWHTYWENGGDAGLPTTIDWVLPDGFTAGPIEWPVPHRYAEEGDVVTFGYADKVLLLTEITAPDDLPVGGRVPIDATVDWLQCKDICIPGGGDVSLRLPVESEIRPAAEAVLTAFGEARARHPQPISSLERVAVHVQQNPTRIAPGESGEIAVIFDGLDGFDLAHSTFLPRPSEEIWMRDGEFRTDGKTLAVVIPVEVDASVEAGSAVLLPAVVEIGSVERHEPWLLTFEVPVDVAPEGVAAVASTAPIFTGGKSFLETAAAAPAAATGAAALLRYLLLAFLGGIILNVM